VRPLKPGLERKDVDVTPSLRNKPSC